MEKVERMKVKIRQATVRDTKIISNIHASSWKIAYKDIVPQRYLDELKYDFGVPAFQNWINNNILTAQLIYDNEIMKRMGSGAIMMSLSVKLLISN